MENSIALKKAEIRKFYREKRSSINTEEKAEIDNRIAENVVNLPEFQFCQTLLTYVSTDDEINTRDIIHIALEKSKKVAVPRTFPSERIMTFYEIASLNELKSGQYGILEPEATPDKRVLGTANTVCLVPGLCFDSSGNRLGYGGGYYDRFLKDFAGIVIGLCRSEQLYKASLPCDPNDIPVKIIVFESRHIRL